MASTSIKNGSNLAQGGGKGYQQTNKHMKQKKEEEKQTQTQNTQMGHMSFLMWGDFLKNLRAQGWAFTDALWKKVINMLYQTEHKETQTKTKWANRHRKNDLLKSLHVPTAR